MKMKKGFDKYGYKLIGIESFTTQHASFDILGYYSIRHFFATYTDVNGNIFYIKIDGVGLINNFKIRNLLRKSNFIEVLSKFPNNIYGLIDGSAEGKPTIKFTETQINDLLSMISNKEIESNVLNAINRQNNKNYQETIQSL